MDSSASSLFLPEMPAGEEQLTQSTTALHSIPDAAAFTFWAGGLEAELRAEPTSRCPWKPCPVGGIHLCAGTAACSIPPGAQKRISVEPKWFTAQPPQHLRVCIMINMLQKHQHDLAFWGAGPRGCRKDSSWRGRSRLAARDVFCAFCNTPGLEAEVSTSQDPQWGKGPQISSTPHYRGKDKLLQVSLLFKIHVAIAA